jgi:peroxiredoxin
MIRYVLAIVVAVSLTAAPAVAGKFNTKLSIGDVGPAWSGLPGVDDKTHSLADLKDKDLVVVAFICNECAVSEVYEDRLIEFTKKYAGPDSKVGFVGISCSNAKGDGLPDMKQRTKDKGFNFVYLHDESQKTGRAYGATVTPEFFVLNKERKIVYMGAMDDSNRAPKVKVKYLEDAISALLKGEKPAPAETAPRGCSLEYAKKAESK